MNSTLFDRILFKDHQKLKGLSDSDKHVLKIAMNGVRAQKITQDGKYTCSTCNVPATWLKTQSERLGEWAVVPSECQSCRLSRKSETL